MRAAVIEDGLVVNLIEVESLDGFSGLTCVMAHEAQIGDTWDGTSFTRAVRSDQPDQGEPNSEPTVPEQIAMWQARAILIEDDLLDTVNEVLSTISDDKARKLAQAKFEYSSTVQRNDPLVRETFSKMGLTEAQIDDMFIRGEALH